MRRRYLPSSIPQGLFILRRPAGMRDPQHDESTNWRPRCSPRSNESSMQRSRPPSSRKHGPRCPLKLDPRQCRTKLAKPGRNYTSLAAAPCCYGCQVMGNIHPGAAEEGKGRGTRVPPRHTHRGRGREGRGESGRGERRDRPAARRRDRAGIQRSSPGPCSAPRFCSAEGARGTDWRRDRGGLVNGPGSRNAAAPAPGVPALSAAQGGVEATWCTGRHVSVSPALRLQRRWSRHMCSTRIIRHSPHLAKVWQAGAGGSKATC